MTKPDIAPDKEEKSVFKTFNADIHLEPIASTEIPTKTRCTDNPCLVIFLVSLLFVVPLTIIFSKGTDLNRFIYGYDRCGDTCGSKNFAIEGLSCSGKDLTEKPIALIRYQKLNPLCPFTKLKILPNICIQNCTVPNQLIFHRCYPPHQLPLNEDSLNMKRLTIFLHIIEQNVTIITLLSLSGIVLTFILFLCLRCHVAVTFWIVTYFQLILFVLITIYLWHKYMTSEEPVLLYLISALGTTGYLLFLLFFLVFFYSSFKLVFGVCKEAVNMIFNIPLILLQPLLTLALLVIAVTSMVFLIFLISSSRFVRPTLEDPSTFGYFSNIHAVIYACYIFFTMMWAYSFVEGCQFMIISGAVSNYYFTRDKSHLRAPFLKSILKILHHLGTVASGSLIVTLTLFMRSIADYMVNKAYIQTAIHGTPFCTSFIRGVRLICSNLINAIAVNGFNYIIINGFSFLAMLLTILLGIWMNSECNYSYYVWMGLIFGAFSACLVTLFMMNIMNITMETIFFCFCEDQIANDGNDRPYYMSERLKQIMEKSREIKMHPLTQETENSV